MNVVCQNLFELKEALILPKGVAESAINGKSSIIISSISKIGRAHV